MNEPRITIKGNTPIPTVKENTMQEIVIEINGQFVKMSEKEFDNYMFEKRQVENKNRIFRRSPKASPKRRSISELMVEKD